MYGNDTDPLNPEGLNGAPASGSPDGALRARIQQALGEADASTPLITADSVELMDIYEREGQKAATKFADQMVRNDRRRERRMRRLHYEDVARSHSIKLAAKKLMEDQQRAHDAAANAQSAAGDASAVGGSADEGNGLGKKPVSEAAPEVAQPRSDTA
jgi:hypothetical protein